MSLYESIFIVQSSLSRSEVEDIAHLFVQAVESNQGSKVIKQEFWGLRDLAYPIKKSSKGYYVMLGIEIKDDINKGNNAANIDSNTANQNKSNLNLNASTEKNTIQKLHESYGFNEKVIRYLTTKVKKFDDTPAELLEQNEENEEKIHAQRRNYAK